MNNNDSGLVSTMKPIYDKIYNVILTLCKLLLIADILITSFAVAGRFIPFLPDPSWSEEVVLTLMSYMAVLSAALAIRRRAHIRMTAFDDYIPKKVRLFSDVIAGFAVLFLGFVMLVIGWRYATTIGALGTYSSMPNVSRFWIYFPIPLAGVAMIIFQIEVLYQDISMLIGAFKDKGDN